MDNTPPTINCSNLTAIANGYCPTVVNFVVPISDNVSVASASTHPASGSLFPLGTNTVTVSATDEVGNSNFCTFTITVTAGAAPELTGQLKGSNFVVSWPATFPCYTLQYATALASNSWSNYPGPIATNGGSILATNSVGAPNRFFRLHY